ncbi:Reticulocyte-binding protein 2 homolog a [Durusdinium trenchii]|uniref:Reticulocyte-binding protein 2 homolog a n=1 Tax=Durusdinium trenchii TaxID=1381693 RepID=A0ABP0N5E7_9DINO
MQELGIDPSEEAYFGWIAEYGLQADVLPSRWSMHVEPQTGRLYYVNSEDGSSSWENPLTESCLRPVIDIGRGYLQAPSDGYFEEQKMALWAAHKHNLEGWHGPHVDEDGREYYANSELNVSSWQDPREETQFIFELQSGLLDALEEMLPGYVEDLPGFGGFGLLDRTPAPPDAMGCMRGDSFAECPTGAPTSPQRSIATPRSERPRAAHAALTAKMERPEPSFGELRQTLVKALDNFFYIYKDDEEAQRLLIGRKLKERRLRKQRLDDEERRKLREELEELRRQEEARQQEEEARRKAEEQRLREQAERVEEEKRRRQEEERRAAEAQRRREEEAKREEERRVEEARRRKQAEEEAARKAKEIRERLLATMQELAQSRDGWVLKNAIAEGESVGLDAELQPLREALKEVHELRKAALLKARKAQEKLANDFKTAKEAQDFGGPVLAAQWRAAVKEVQKPFVMPE